MPPARSATTCRWSSTVSRRSIRTASGPAPSRANDEDLAGIVEAVARSPLPEHSDLARSVARQVLDAAELPSAGIDAVVVRRNARLRVTLTLPPGAEAGETGVTAKVLGALRRFDPDARGIDLGFAR